MEENRHQGRLERWNDNRGFGFIHPERDSRDVFVHISAFKNRLSRRPRVGDVILYEIHTEQDGRVRAVNAMIEGSVLEKHNKPRKIALGKTITHRNKKWGGKGISLLLIIGIVVFLYNRLSFESYISSSGVEVIPSNTESATRRYSCQGKIHCSEMTSCEEAMFYQHNCPATKMDGDGDGIPCESQWCGR